MSAQRRRIDIELVIGDSYSHVLEFDTDQSEYTFAVTLSDDTGATVQTFSTTISGTEVTVTLNANQTTNLSVNTQYKWRAIRTLDNEVTTVAAGRAVVIDL